MPSFTKEIEFEFEVFCGTCNAGLCPQTTVRESFGRRFPQIVVEVCDDCLQKAKKEAIEPLEEANDELKEEIKALKEKLEELLNG